MTFPVDLQRAMAPRNVPLPEPRHITLRMAFSGDWDGGVALIDKAFAFNVSVVPNVAYYATAKHHYVRGEYPEAIAEFRKTFIPGFWLNDLVSACTYAAWGKQEEAETAAAELLKKRPDFVIEDALVFYRKWQVQNSYLEKMAAVLRQAGQPSRADPAQQARN